MSKEIILGTALASARKASSLSQHEMGKKLGLTQVRVSQLERDPNSLNLATIRKWHENVTDDGKALIDKSLVDFLYA